MRRDELRLLQFGWHIAGAALHINRKSMPPQAITFRPYIAMQKPRGVKIQCKKSRDLRIHELSVLVSF